MFSMHSSRIPRLLTRAASGPSRAERRARAEERMAEFDRTSERAVLAHLRRIKYMPDPDWASQPVVCAPECPARRLDVLLGESRQTVTRCVHGSCIETAMRPIGAAFACELHKQQPEGN
jgi:hypothetical protein